MVPPLPFETEYDALSAAYYSLDAHAEVQEDAGAVSRAQRKLELQSQMAQLSVAHGELERALGHYEAIYEWIESKKLQAQDEKEETDPSLALGEDHEEEDTGESQPTDEDAVPPSLRVVLPELQINALANMSAVHHRRGDFKSAMARLLTAKKAMRELREALVEADTSSERLESLHRLETALTVNHGVLLQSQGGVEDAVLTAEAALRLTGPSLAKEKKPTPTEDATIATARQVATDVLVSGHYTKRETDKVQALSSQAEKNLNELSHDSDPHILARSHNNAALLCFENREFTTALRHWLTAYRALLTSNPPDTSMRTIVRYHIGRTLMALDTTTALPGSSDLVDAQQCLTQVEGIAPDPLASVMAQASLGELAYDAGDFALATTRLTSAIADLRHLNETDYTSRLNGSSNQDLAQMQGYIESFLGNALLADGKPDEAELAHQRDLELALDSEDLHAQLRAIRNLAVLYREVQRHAEAVPLWHEVVEIATVLASQRDLLIAYGGLGTTLHELSIIDSRKGEHQALLAERSHEPRAIFLKQRALAMTLGDLESQVLAQRQIVRTYEWPSKPDELEHRLEACDLLVTLSEQLNEATHRADAYRALANAITAQVARLAARGQRFAEAIHVLKAKRNAVLQKFRDATAMASGSKAPLPRPAPLGRVTVLQRSLL